MEKLKEALSVVEKYQRMSFSDLVDEFEKISGQTISENVFREFQFTGLSNIDFLTSDFLNQYGYKNLNQI